jgi:hypothetical protein
MPTDTPPPQAVEDSTVHVTVNGPALLYISTKDRHGTQTVQRVDLTAPADSRERALCRALLTHALELLDQSVFISTLPGGA